MTLVRIAGRVRALPGDEAIPFFCGHAPLGPLVPVQVPLGLEHMLKCAPAGNIEVL